MRILYMITNKPKEDFSIHDAMMAHKNQYKIEHINRRAKSGFSLEPIYLQTPERIEAFLMLFKTALQIIVLIERTARKNIEERNRGLDNFMPNRKDVRNPRTEYLLSEFQYVVKGNLLSRWKHLWICFQIEPIARRYPQPLGSPKPLLLVQLCRKYFLIRYLGAARNRFLFRRIKKSTSQNRNKKMSFSRRAKRKFYMMPQN